MKTDRNVLRTGLQNARMRDNVLSEDFVDPLCMVVLVSLVRVPLCMVVFCIPHSSHRIVIIENIFRKLQVGN